MNQDQAGSPGSQWRDIITRPSQEAFAAAFVKDAFLEASVLNAPIVGTSAIRGFFDATRSMYDQIAFVHEARSDARTCLEWEGRFAGRDIAGTTILIHNADGAIERIGLYHRPYDQVIAFAAELAHRMAGQIVPGRPRSLDAPSGL